MSGRFEYFDARPGGGYRMVLSYDTPGHGKTTADSDVAAVRFVEIELGVRIVQEVEFVSDDPRFAGTMTMTWEVAPVEDGSHVEIRAENVPSGVSAEDHAAGLASSLGNLAEYLARQDCKGLRPGKWAGPAHSSGQPNEEAAQTARYGPGSTDQS
jgi:uncharacterized protein YndB with AHSA1/START domain